MKRARVAGVVVILVGVLIWGLAIPMITPVVEFGPNSNDAQWSSAAQWIAIISLCTGALIGVGAVMATRKQNE